MLLRGRGALAEGLEELGQQGRFNSSSLHEETTRKRTLIKSTKQRINKGARRPTVSATEISKTAEPTIDAGAGEADAEASEGGAENQSDTTGVEEEERIEEEEAEEEADEDGDEGAAATERSGELEGGEEQTTRKEIEIEPPAGVNLKALTNKFLKQRGKRQARRRDTIKKTEIFSD